MTTTLSSLPSPRKPIPKTQNRSEIHHFLLTALSVSFAIKYHLYFDFLSPCDLFSQVSHTYLTYLNVNPLPVEHFYDCVENAESVSILSQDIAFDEESRMKGAITLVGFLLIMTFLLGKAVTHSDP